MLIQKGTCAHGTFAAENTVIALLHKVDCDELEAGEQQDYKSVGHYCSDEGLIALEACEDPMLL